jgi:hypothetical protein
LSRLAAEYDLSRTAVVDGDDPADQSLIVRTWMEWYRDALESTADIELGGSSVETRDAIELAVAEVVRVGEDYLNRLLTEGG